MHLPPLGLLVLDRVELTVGVLCRVRLAVLDCLCELLLADGWPGIGLRPGSFWCRHLDSTRRIAFCSALVTVRWYLCLTAAWRAT